jgi:lipoprotein-anchoring transpeptidase ErfK/SrfK
MKSLIYQTTTRFKNRGRVFAHGIRLLIALSAVAWATRAAAAQTKVIINLSEQRAYLVEEGRVTLVSPIASGKPGWPTPTGNFSIFNKDIDHRSRSFGSVIDTYGGVVNGNATPSSRVPRGCHYRPASMPYFMEFSPAVGMHAGYLPGYPASHGCVRMPRDFAALFFERVHTGTPVRVVGSTKDLTRVRRAIPILPTRSLVMGERQRNISFVSYLHSK